MPATLLWGKLPAEPTTPTGPFPYQTPQPNAIEAPFDYSVGQWTDRFRRFIDTLPIDYIKKKLAPYRNFTGMNDAQIRSLAIGYGNQLGYQGSPSVTKEMKGPSTPPPTGAIFPTYNTPPTTTEAKSPAELAPPKLSSQTQQLAEAYNPLPTAPTFGRQRFASPFSLPKYYGAGAGGNRKYSNLVR